LMLAAWMIARCEECAGRAYDTMKVEEKRGGLAARAVVFSKPSCGKRAKPYESAGACKRLAPCKLHVFPIISIPSDLKFVPNGS